jgi:hypothetical protein
MVSHRLPLHIASWFIFSSTGISFAADFPRYQFTAAKTIQVDMPLERTPIERKDILDCDQFLFSERDFRFAIRHRKPVAQDVFNHEAASVGCYGGATVTFASGESASMLINPFGGFELSLTSGRRKGEVFYFLCRACADSKTFARNPVYPK